MRKVPFVAALILLFAGSSCGPGSRGERSAVAPAGGEGRRVLVIQNLDEPASRRVAAHYLRRRDLDPDQLCSVSTSAGEEISLDAYRREIEEPVRRRLRMDPLLESVDFLVTTRGIPLRIAETGGSVDAMLGAMDLALPIPTRGDPQSLARAANPYFGQDRPFSRRDFGFYLVTRLDGPDERQARSLVDRALRATAAPGPFLFDLDPRRDNPGYGLVNRGMRRAAAILEARGWEVMLDTTPEFRAPPERLAGYYSWGSNDGAFSRRAYRALRFLPGSIAETAVSSSGRTFRSTPRGQSLMTDLIPGGLTGAKGYVSEPFVTALCPADILFDRYLRGYTLAESYGMACPFLKWKDVVIGDPLCAPYAVP